MMCSMGQLSFFLIHQYVSINRPVAPHSFNISYRGQQPDPEPYVGTYHNLDYGNITICPLVNPSTACRKVLDDFASIQDQVELDTWKLYGYYGWPKLWAKYIALTLQLISPSKTTFRFDTTTIFPQGYGANTTAFQERVDGGLPEVRADFVHGDDEFVTGFGLFGLAGEELRREREGRTVEEKAEVWFVKIA
jgi:hypothetical protein